MLASVSLTSCSGHRARKKNIRNTRHPILCGFHSSTVLTVSAQSINLTCMMPRSKSDVSAVPNAFANHSSSCFLKKNMITSFPFARVISSKAQLCFDRANSSMKALPRPKEKATCCCGTVFFSHSCNDCGLLPQQAS